MSQKRWIWTGNNYVEVGGDKTRNNENKIVDWRTTKTNVHYPIKEGQTPKEALDDFMRKHKVREIQLPIQEHAILRKEVFRKNVAQHGKVKPLNHAYTANYFYVYETTGYDGFNVLLCFDIERDRETINEVLEVLKLWH